MIARSLMVLAMVMAGLLPLMGSRDAGAMTLYEEKIEGWLYTIDVDETLQKQIFRKELDTVVHFYCTKNGQDLALQIGTGDPLQNADHYHVQTRVDKKASQGSVWRRVNPYIVRANDAKLIQRIADDMAQGSVVEFRVEMQDRTLIGVMTLRGFANAYSWFKGECREAFQ